ncbi:hypothetical protein [Yersinia mollaretii]|uniref:hypothetical protein n=1 Tax=Yersinia mollaretii TaxID=33060 RepID=UPI001643D78C|nr:hypothetical protein [Yersinia mollaretii]
MAMPRALLRSNSCSSPLASNLSGVSPSSENSPLSHTKSAGEENCHCFSQNSAGGKPLPMVDGEKHIQALHLHLSQGKSSVCDFPDFSKVMNQGNESCIRASNILHGTKAALAMFCMLPADKRDSVTTEAKSFYKAMANMSKDSGSAKSAEKELEKFNKALLKESGLDNKSTDKQSNLEQLCTDYLNKFVYSDVIDKLSAVVTPEQLEVIKGNPEQVVNTLYSTLNETNNLMTGLLSDGFLAHHGVNDKAAQMHELITKLEHKTEIIAGIISNSLASDSPAASANGNLPESPQIASASHANMASPTTPANGANPLPSSPVHNLNPVFNNNPIINIDLNGVLDPIVRVIDRLVDKLEKVIPMDVRLSPGNMNGSAEPTRHMESTKVDTQTPEATREIDPPTYAEVVEPLQSEKIQLKPTAPLMVAPMVQKTLTSGDDIDGASTPTPAATQAEAPAMTQAKKATYSLNAHGTAFGTQVGVTQSSGSFTRVPLTNGAISGSSQSASYASSDTNRVAAQSKIVPLAGTEIEGSPQPDKMQAKPTAPLMTQSMAQKTLASGDDIDGASTPTPTATQAEAPAMTQAKKATYSLNAQGTAFGTQVGVTQSSGSFTRVALTNGAISGSSQSTSYANSDTNGFAQINSSSTNEQLAEALKSGEEQSGKTAKSVNSAGSAFQGLYSTPNSTQINFTPKNKTTEYRLNKLLNGKAN